MNVCWAGHFSSGFTKFGVGTTLWNSGKSRDRLSWMLEKRNSLRLACIRDIIVFVQAPGSRRRQEGSKQDQD